MKVLMCLRLFRVTLNFSLNLNIYLQVVVFNLSNRLYNFIFKCEAFCVGFSSVLYQLIKKQK